MTEERERYGDEKRCFICKHADLPLSVVDTDSYHDGKLICNVCMARAIENDAAAYEEE
jgi:hypothetical protein